MDRCHLYLPLVDSSGAPYSYAEITLLDPATDQPVTEPVYLDPIGGAPQTWPLLLDSATVDVWTDQPMRVTLVASLPGGATMTRAGVDIAPAPAATVRSSLPLRLGSADGLDGSALLAVSPTGDANWQVLDVLQFHQHGGASPDSTVIGPAPLSDIYPGQVWVGSGTGATSANQGEESVALGAGAVVNGLDATAVGKATADDSAVAVGSTATAGPSSVALGQAASSGGAWQVVLGQAASASTASGAVAVGSAAAVPAGGFMQVANGIRGLPDGTLVLGSGTVPTLAGLTGTQFLALLNSVVAPRFFQARKDAVLAGAASPLGFYGTAGSLRTIMDTSALAANAPGHDALVSLLSALDRMGLIYLTDSSLDDELADWTRTYAHDANLVFDTVGDSSGYFAGDTTRIKRNGSATSAVTYYVSNGIRDFAARVFTSAPVDVTTEVTAQVSADGTTWTSIPVAWQPLVVTSGEWQQTWASNARPIPLQTKYLRLLLGVNTLVYAPQIGRVIVRTDNTIGFGQGGFGENTYGGY